jgi:hypothetical protein
MANDAAAMTSTIPARALRMETETPSRQLLVEAIDLKHQRLATYSEKPLGGDDDYKWLFNYLRRGMKVKSLLDSQKFQRMRKRC